jgi:hypothetical protein
MQRRRPRRVGPANDTCLLQSEKFCLGDAELVRIQSPGFGENGTTAGFDGMADAVQRTRSTLSIADDGRKGGKEVPDWRHDVAESSGKFGRQGRNGGAQRLEGGGVQNETRERVDKEAMCGQEVNP